MFWTAHSVGLPDEIGTEIIEIIQKSDPFFKYNGKFNCKEKRESVYYSENSFIAPKEIDIGKDEF